MATSIGPSKNFKNPFGLLFRMLASGQRAAYSALIHEGMRLVSRPLNSLLAGRERRIRESTPPVAAPVILVVGAPRSGTTLVYQTLARYMDVTYFSNLTALFPKVPLGETKTFRWLPRRQSADFKNLVVYIDETGWKVGKKGCYTWIVSTALHVLFRCGVSRRRPKRRAFLEISSTASA